MQSFVSVSHGPVATAQCLADLDAAMRRNLTHYDAVTARFRFYEAAIRRFAIGRLNRLGGMIPRSQLGDRSMDLVFEDRRYASDVLARAVALAEQDIAFREALIEQEGPAQFAYMRARVARDLFGHAIAA